MLRSIGSRHRVRPERRSGWSRPPTAGSAPTFATSPVYRPRRPAETPLYRVVQHHLNTFPRMAEVAAHLRAQVIPRVSARQWVLSVPERPQPALAGDAGLAGAGLRVLLRVIHRALRDTAVAGTVLRILLRVIHRALQDTAGVPLPAEARLGAVSFLHRFGSALNPHPHFHLAVTDGLFARRRDGLTFHPARRLDSDTARSVPPLLKRSILRQYVRRGLLTRAEADDMLRLAPLKLLDRLARLIPAGTDAERWSTPPPDDLRGPHRRHGHLPPGLLPQRLQLSDRPHVGPGVPGGDRVPAEQARRSPLRIPAFRYAREADHGPGLQTRGTRITKPWAGKGLVGR